MRPVFEITPPGGSRWLDLRELWAYRELLYFFTWRNVTVRYQQTTVGIAWALLQPLSLMLVFTLFFGRFVRVPTDGVPYPLFAYAAILPWQLFARVLSDSTTSLVLDQRVVTRVYFPRILVPLAACLAAAVDFLVGATLLLPLLVIYGVAPGFRLALLPAAFLLLLVAAIGAGAWLSALNIEYRDVVYALPFLIQVWFFLTPIVYPTSVVPPAWRFLFALNPMTTVVDAFRWALLRQGPPSGAMILCSTGAAFLLLASGVVWFRSREPLFADALGSGGR